jgi:putative PIN family toxin of toxin-antitoxin system
VKVVFDTNIVASASFWRGKPFDCLNAWADGKVEAVVSPQLLTEYFDTIAELEARYPTKLRVAWAESLTATAELAFPQDRAAGEVSDPDDELILECAWAGKADCIVSGDKEHLLPLGAWRGIKIISAAEMLNLL